MRLITSFGAPTSWARELTPTRGLLRVALVQHRWRGDTESTMRELEDGIALAASQGAKLVALPELTLARYPADERPLGDPRASAENLADGATMQFARDQAIKYGVFLHASVFRHDDEPDALGTNTAILVAPDGSLVGQTDKLHIPVTEGYFEDHYFRAAAPAEPYPVYRPHGLNAGIGLPTCWDEWFPEVARAYSLADADILIYPTAIGSEPDFPDFDTEPLWRQVIVGNGIANGLFMVVPNRWGNEGRLRFYGSSFISDPYGRILVRAPRDESAVLVADVDVDQRRDWLTLFPFLRTRRPDTYEVLTEPVDRVRRTIS